VTDALKAPPQKRTILEPTLWHCQVRSFGTVVPGAPKGPPSFPSWVAPTLHVWYANQPPAVLFGMDSTFFSSLEGRLGTLYRVYYLDSREFQSGSSDCCVNQTRNPSNA
jgi:hypothetical protein